jgi:hypothetical protein
MTLPLRPKYISPKIEAFLPWAFGSRYPLQVLAPIAKAQAAVGFPFLSLPGVLRARLLVVY